MERDAGPPDGGRDVLVQDVDPDVDGLAEGAVEGDHLVDVGLVASAPADDEREAMAGRAGGDAQEELEVLGREARAGADHEPAVLDRGPVPLGGRPRRPPAR